MKLFLLLLFCTSIFGQQGIYQEIACPISQDIVRPGELPTQEDCELYSDVCFWEAFDSRCIIKKNNEIGYTVSGPTIDTGRGFIVPLTKINSSVSVHGNGINNLNFEVIYHEDYHLQIKITDAENDRYEIPYLLNVPEIPGTNPLYSVEVSPENSSFTFNITRVSTGAAVWRNRGPLIYEDQFILMSCSIENVDFYGLGEQWHTTLRHTFFPSQTFVLWNRDQILTRPDINHYGSHPYYVNIEDDVGNTHSVLFYSSNAAEYDLFTFANGLFPGLTIKTIGGIVDLHFFLGPTPEDCNMQYANAVGYPVFPQYWNFGYQLSRYGYNSTAAYIEVRNRTRDANIPQDVQTFDIDYMDRRRDFTLDPDNFADLPEVVDNLHNENIKVICMFDPAVVIDWDNYEPSARGRDMDVFIPWSNPSLIPEDQCVGCLDYVVGYVWPDNKTVFPDFFKPNTTLWWTSESQIFKNMVDFDGMWIDMNEPANFGTNEDRPFNYPPELEDWSLHCTDSPLDAPPYPTIAAYVESGNSKISDKTICMESVQTDDVNVYSHYDVHNLYGLSETIATAVTHQAIFPNQRPTILSRSTFPGSGKYAVHWLGDNMSTWEHLKQSIIGMIEFNMFAFPMVGADVCGFLLDATEDLCIRWTQAAAFYPLCRNHNDNLAADQDPARPGWNLAPILIRDVLNLRYKYIPYLYLLFHAAHMRGASVIRPLFNVFPSDLNARNIGDQFFQGTGIMVAPVMEEDAVSRSVYFPGPAEEAYYDLKTGEFISNGGASLIVDAPINVIPAYVKGRSILPWQVPALNTVESRQNPMGLTVAIDPSSNSATGELYWDDGINEHDMAASYLAQIDYQVDTLSLEPQFNITAADGVVFGFFDFYGFSSTPTQVLINGLVLSESEYTYNSTLETLNIALTVTLIPINEALTIIIE